MSKPKKQKKNKTFKQAKYYLMTFRFGGSLICAYFVFKCIFDTITFYQEGKTSGVVIFLLFTLMFIYFTISLLLDGLRAAKAKKPGELS